MSKYLLGVDNGLTGIKAAIFDQTGQSIASHGSETPLENRGGGIVEIDQIKLWETTASVIRKTIDASGIDSGDIAAIANSAHGNGIYLLDRDENPLPYAIMPMDSRAKDIVKRWEIESVSEKIFGYTLQKAWAGQPAAILNWLKEFQPSVYAQIGHVLFCKDWIKYKLTGKFSTDYSDISAAGLLDCNEKLLSAELFNLYGISEILDKLPQIIKSWEISGYVNCDAAEITGLKEGTPVASGMFDVNACCLGTGVYAPGTYSIIAGTWGINSIISAQKIQSKQIVQCTVFADGEQYLCIDSGATSTVNLEWFLKNSCKENVKTDYEELEKIITNFNPALENPLFMPYVYESIHHPKVNASFIGLKAEHKWENMLCAVFEGVALGHGLQLKRLKSCGLEANTAVFAGGASKSLGWCKIFTDVMGIPMETREEEQAGALGAAMAAGIAVGIFRDIKEAVESMVRKKAIYLPDMQNYKTYQKRKKIINDLIEIFSKISEEFEK